MAKKALEFLSANYHLTNTSRKSTAWQPRAQLSIVEHALCPLDSRLSLNAGLKFETGFDFTDMHRNRKRADVRVAAIHGLSPSDDFFLWGLLGLALAQPEPSSDFQATPYWCLKQLGIITSRKKGSEEYRNFRESLRRLAGVRYECDKFYDPLRKEHREVSFGFLSYSLPLSGGRSRTWRFAWDPVFWGICSSNAGALRFDIDIYRSLSPASRRLYLFLKKVFWRREESPQMEIRELAISTLGFSPQLPTNEIKRKLLLIVQQLLDRELIAVNQGQNKASDCFRKKAKGHFTLQFCRGPNFDKKSNCQVAALEDSPLYDPLLSLGFDKVAVTRIIAKHPYKLIQLWSDITLAAVEQGRIKTSPQAFFTYYLNRANNGQSTPPDWWHDSERQRRGEELAQRKARGPTQTPLGEGIGFQQYLDGEAKVAFQAIMDQLERDMRNAGRSRGEAESIAREHATIHFRNRFRLKHNSKPAMNTPFDFPRTYGGVCDTDSSST